MKPSSPKLRSVEIQVELVPVAADELNFAPEISNLAQQAHTTYFEKTTQNDARLKALRKYQSELDGILTDEEIKNSDERRAQFERNKENFATSYTEYRDKIKLCTD